MERRALIKIVGLAMTSLAVPHRVGAVKKYFIMTEKKDFDVIIIGGSYAGLSAAMALGRSLRSVLIIDSGLPCNRQTPHSHNFLTQDGQKPSEIASKGKQEVLNYGTIQFLEGIAAAGKKTKTGFSITTKKGEEFHATKLIFATGIKDTMPNIKGFAQCWGISVVHCPYCHGYELRGKKTAIMANGERAFHLASLVKNLTGDISIFTSGKAEFKADQIAKLNKHNIKVIEPAIIEVGHEKGHIKYLILKGGTKMEFDAMYAGLPFVQHSDIPTSLGCELNENGFIKVDGFQKTSVSGVYACGDNSNMMRSVANAVYSGNVAGAVLNKELTDDLF